MNSESRLHDLKRVQIAFVCSESSIPLEVIIVFWMWRFAKKTQEIPPCENHRQSPLWHRFLVCSRLLKEALKSNEYISPHEDEYLQLSGVIHIPGYVQAVDARADCCLQSAIDVHGCSTTRTQEAIKDIQRCLLELFWRYFTLKLLHSVPKLRTIKDYMTLLPTGFPHRIPSSRKSWTVDTEAGCVALSSNLVFHILGEYPSSYFLTDLPMNSKQPSCAIFWFHTVG
jgi:hypothetical protein